jgi:hypothetical protein
MTAFSDNASENIAVILVHGVGDTGPGDMIDAVAGAVAAYAGVPYAAIHRRRRS